MKKRNICIAGLITCVALLLIYEFVGLDGLGIHLPDGIADSVGMIFTRGLSGLVFLSLLWYMDYKVLDPFKKPYLRSLVFCIPALCVVVNNLHIYTLATGVERVTGDGASIALFALECLCVALFEEMAFRGVVFLRILEYKRERTANIFWAIVLSSAAFGLVHLVNLFYMSPGLVLMQIGYSFLIGGMCAVVLLRTQNIWLCVVLHALFNFCGNLVPRLGEGFTWDVPTIVITVIIAVFTTVYMVYHLIKTPMKNLDTIYTEEANERN